MSGKVRLCAAVVALVLGVSHDVDAGSRIVVPTAPHAAAHDLHDVHDVHLTYSRVVVDGARVLWRVRLFRDDLEKTLAAWSRNAALNVTTPAADTAFASYFNAQVPVTANGKRLTGKVLESGRDADVTDQEMWWYLIELPASAPVTSLGTRVGLLFEHFSDQRNIVSLLKMPGGERYSMYFVPGDTKLQNVIF